MVLLSDIIRHAVSFEAICDFISIYVSARQCLVGRVWFGACRTNVPDSGRIATSEYGWLILTMENINICRVDISSVCDFPQALEE